MIDIAIIGNGPAGLSASLYTSRAGLSTTIIGKDFGSLQKADKIENYFGFENPISGKELVENGINQAKRLGVNIINGEVLELAYNDAFIIKTKETQVEAKACILATGTSRKSSKIDGLKEFEGRGVSYCAVCDAFFYRKKAVAVLGTGDYAMHEIMELAPIVGSVFLLTNGKNVEVNVPNNIKIINKPIKHLFGAMSLEGAQFDDGSTLLFSGLFVAMGSAAASDLAYKVGAEVEGVKVIVDSKMATNLPGLFAAGDCTGGILQISKAVADGTQAGLSAIEFVRKNKVKK